MLPELSRRLRRMGAVRRAAVPAYQAYRRATAPRDGHRMLVNSMGKSGTHLLSSQLTRLPEVSFSGIGAIHDQHAVQAGPSGEMPVYDEASLERQLGRCPRSSFVMSHLYWDRATEAMLDRLGYAAVQIVRDPRDILVSRLHYIRDNESHPARRAVLEQFPTWEDQLVAIITGFPDSSFGRGWAPFNRRIELFLPWVERIPTVRYEAFVSADPATRRAEQSVLLEGLGLQTSPAALDQMTGGIGDKWSATMRQGGSGGWRAAFSDHAYDRFVDVAGEATTRMGYSLD